jgi:hypothetical protein
MKMHFGGSSDFSNEERSEAVNDYVSVITYGAESSVLRTDGKSLRFVFEQDNGRGFHRKVFHLLPYGEYGADPFPDGCGENERDFDFFVAYERDDQKRTAKVTLRAYLDDPISWVALVLIDDVRIDTNGPDSINRDIGDTSVIERMGWEHLASIEEES